MLSFKIENVNSPTLGLQDCFGHSVSEETYALKIFLLFFSGTETKTGKYCLQLSAGCVLAWLIHAKVPYCAISLTLTGPQMFCLLPGMCIHAKLLQSCPTLHDPTDCNLPGSSVYGILQARILEWVAISFPASRNHLLAQSS